MKVIRIDTYRDGGTQEIETTEGTFWKDGRISSITRGKFYAKAFPGKETSLLIDDDLYEQKLRLAIESFNNKAVNDYGKKLDAKTEAQNLIKKFYNHGCMTVTQAQLAASTHIDLLITGNFVDSERMTNFWKNVKFQIYNEKRVTTEDDGN